MEFEWDENKRRRNLEKHDIDFLDADLIFGSPHLLEQARTVDDEQRWLAVGMIEDVHVTAVFTHRGDAIRIISIRKARDAERRKYQEVFRR